MSDIIRKSFEREYPRLKKEVIDKLKTPNNSAEVLYNTIEAIRYGYEEGARSRNEEISELLELLFTAQEAIDCGAWTYLTEQIGVVLSTYTKIICQDCGGKKFIKIVQNRPKTGSFDIVKPCPSCQGRGYKCGEKKDNWEA